MLSAFWNGVGGKLAEQWVTRLFTPALLFWTTGGLSWCWSQRPASARGHSVLTDLGNAIQYSVEALGRLSGPQQIAWLVAALLTIVGSAAVAERLTAPFLRWTEGYWPSGRPRWFWDLLVWLARWRRQRLRKQWGRLRRLSAPTPRERTREGVLAGRLHSMPPEELMMPTALGNILRASELRPARRYGLDPTVAWPRLWLVLPEPTRQEIAGSRGQLDAAGRGMLWALVAAVWSVFVWWIAPAAVVVGVALYRGSVLPAARVYADLIEATFDLHRPALYDALRLPRPDRPADELAAGQLLTAYLWEGYAPEARGFHDPSLTVPVGNSLK